MPINATQPTGTSTTETSLTPTKTKRKAARKTTSAPPASRSSSPAQAAPAEILFKELPNPYLKPEPPYIWIDYPQQNDRLSAPVYVIRLGVGGAEQVEISIDNGPWQNCRLTSGYRWFDWSGITRGKHTLVARMRTSDGRVFRTPARNCDYRP